MIYGYLILCSSLYSYDGYELFKDVRRFGQWQDYDFQPSRSVHQADYMCYHMYLLTRKLGYIARIFQVCGFQMNINKLVILQFSFANVACTWMQSISSDGLSSGTFLKGNHGARGAEFKPFWGPWVDHFPGTLNHSQNVWKCCDRIHHRFTLMATKVGVSPFSHTTIWGMQLIVYPILYNSSRSH